MSFLELLMRNEEFRFEYNKKEYEIVSCDEYGNYNVRSVYSIHEKSEKFLQSFSSNEELLYNFTIDGKHLLEILDKINV